MDYIHNPACSVHKQPLLYPDPIIPFLLRSSTEGIAFPSPQGLSLSITIFTMMWNTSLVIPHRKDMETRHDNLLVKWG